MKFLKNISIALVTVLSFAQIANASTILWDQSPDTIGGTVTSLFWSNESAGQNFGEQVQFITDTTITGMDVYMTDQLGNVGDTATVRIWLDDFTLFDEFTVMISATDTDGAANYSGAHRLFAEFDTGVNLVAGQTYLVGMSGTSAVYTQMGMSGATGPLINSGVARFSGVDFIVNATDVQDTAFRLYGDITQVSAPGTIALLGLGLLCVRVGRRKAC